MSARKRADSPSPHEAAALPTTASDPYNVPGFSIVLLGQQLAAAERRYCQLNSLTTRLGSEEPRSRMDKKRLEQRRAESAEEATADHTYALQDLILKSRAVTPADAVVQLMVCGASLSRIDRSKDGEKLEEVVDRALEGSIRVLAAHYGVDLASVGGVHYQPVACEKWPDVAMPEDVGDDPAEDPCWRRAIDGTFEMPA